MTDESLSPEETCECLVDGKKCGRETIGIATITATMKDDRQITIEVDICDDHMTEPITSFVKGLDAVEAWKATRGSP